MTTTRMAATIDYLVTTFTASVLLGASTTAPVRIYDGPEVTSDPGLVNGELWVGIEDPDSDKMALSGESEQEWVGLGARQRDELFRINCAAVWWSGSDSVKGARDGVYAIIAAIEDIVRTNANLGGNVLYVNPGVTGHQLYQATTDKGAVAKLLFRIDCKARIGG